MKGIGRRVIFGGVVALGWVAAGPTARAADAKVDLVELKGSDTVRLDATKATDAIELSLRISPDVELTSVKVVQVSLDTDNHGPWSSAFTPTFSQEPGAPVGRPKKLVVTVDLEKAHHPGTYVVTLEVSGKPRPVTPTPGKAAAKAKISEAALEPQSLELKLVHPDAQLKVDGPIVVERVVVIPWLSTRVRATPFIVRETSGAARVTNLVFTQPHDAQRKDRPEGRLYPEPTWPTTVAAAGRSEVTFAAKGDFSMGTAQGTLEISGDQVKAPVSVSYEIRSRLGEHWVFILIALGLATGFGLRTLAPRIIATSQIVVDVGSFMVELEPYRKDPDDVLRKTVADLAAQVGAALDDVGKSDDLATRIVAVRTAFAAAVKARDDRAQDVAQKLRALAALFDAPSFGPKPLADAVASHRDELAKVRAAFEARNFSGAGDLARATTEALAHDFPPLVKAWRETLDGLLAKLASFDGVLPAGTASELGGIPDLRKKLTELANRNGADPGTLLDDVSRAHSDCGTLLGHVVEIVKTEAAGVLEGLAAVDDGAIAPELADLTRDLQAIGGIDPALANVSALPEALRKVSVAARTAALKLCAQAGRWQGKEEQRDAIVARIEAQQLRSAAEDIKRELGIRNGVADLVGRAAGALITSGVGESRFVVHHLAFHQPSLALTVIPPRGPTEKQRAAAEKRIRRVKRAQYVLAAGVILLVGAATLGETFVGTPVEILGLFFWGFGTDVSVATATELTHKK